MLGRIVILLCCIVGKVCTVAVASKMYICIRGLEARNCTVRIDEKISPQNTFSLLDGSLSPQHGASSGSDVEERPRAMEVSCEHIE
jgi:hypothetical protein